MYAFRALSDETLRQLLAYPNGLLAGCARGSERGRDANWMEWPSGLGEGDVCVRVCVSALWGCGTLL